MEPLDLTAAPPRAPRVELDGLVFLPRTIDKLRAQLPGGNLGEYFINGPMLGLSGYLLQRLGIDEQQLRDVVAREPDDVGVAAWLRANTDATTYSEISATIVRLKPKHSQNPAVFAEIYRETLAAHPNLEYIIDIIAADDERLFPGRVHGS